jgi:hypothetical protein
MSIWKYIWNLLSNLFNWDPKEGEKKKELRKMSQYLLSISPPYYRQSTKQVLPGFARVLYEYAYYLQFIRELFQKTIHHNDHKLAERFHNYLIECHLPENEQLKHHHFAYEELYARLVNALSPREEINKINHEFKEYIKLFDKPEFDVIDNHLNELNKFSTLCQHNFNNFLVMFDPHITISHKKRKPSFNPVQGFHIIPDLLDLYFIIADFSLSSCIEQNIFLLIERLKPKNSDNVKDKMKTILRRIDVIQKKYLKPSLLLALLRVIKNDPAFTADINEEKIPYLKHHTDKLNSQFTKNMNRLLKEVNENALMKEIDALLGSRQLVPISGYNDTENDFLQRHGLHTFNYVKPLTILKNFIISHYGKKEIALITKLLFEGFFENKLFRNNISEVFNGCNDSLGRITEFEKSLLVDETSPLSRIHHIFEGKGHTETDSEDFAILIDVIDKKAGGILEKETNLFYSLSSHLFEIIDDSKKKSPSIVSNIRVIGGNNNSDLIKSLTECYEHINKLISIIQNFTIIQDNVKKLSE